jgi:hypothetical protein
MKLYMIRRGSHLEPINAEMEDELRRVPEKTVVEVTVIQKRNVKHNSLYWTILVRVTKWLGQDNVPVEAMHDLCKVENGVVTIIKLPHGDVKVLPGSTAFDRMDQVQFSEYFEKVIRYLYSVLLVPPRLIANLLLPKAYLEPEPPQQLLEPPR